MEDMTELRRRIDDIDDRIFELFVERTDTAEEIGRYKKANGLRVYDRTRERAKVADVTSKVPDDLKTYSQVLMELLMEASRMRQTSLVGTPGTELERIRRAIATTPDRFPQDSFVACQGVEGAYSQIATERIFKHPTISYFDAFEGVFRAVEQGFCEFGVLPVENSTAGSVNKVYDLMMEHDFHVIRTTRLKIDHNLLARHGASIEGIRDIYSHEQAISQCAGFLDSLDGVRVHVCENTAVAAQRVADSDRDDVAALSSRACADLYDLDVLAHNVQDRDDNYTRFACISRDLRIYPGSDRASLMIVVDHRPGALYKVLAKFYALDINISKLESRPIPGRDFEFMFYFDIDCPAASPEFETLMSTLPGLCEECRYLGSYTEVV